MNQEKIGKFIASLRKEKNMTQMELAQKLNVTDRAISNWENGKNLPDLSLFKTICSVLDITINELISGEKLNNNDYQERFEENIINTVLYSKNKKLKRKNIFVISIAIIVVIFSILFFIDKSRMKNGNQVLFSTWGKVYYPKVDYETKYIERDVKKYIYSKMKKEFTRGDGKIFKLNNFISIHPFLIDKVSDEEIVVYLWAITGYYYKDDDAIKIEDEVFPYESPISKPYKIILRKVNDYTYEGVRIKTSEEWVTDEYMFIKKEFPKKIHNEVDNFKHDGSMELLYYEFYDMIDNFYFYQ